MQIRTIAPVAFLLLGLSACLKEETGLPYEASAPKLPNQVYQYSVNQDTRIQAQLQQQAITDHGATLGRVLFYEPAMSRTNTVSCASCHLQQKGFADGESLSTGFDGQKTTRNSIGFSNLIMQSQFFWDGRESDLKSMSTKPIENHIEMGLPEMPILVEKLKSRGYYAELFRNAYGTEEITTERIGDALAQFLNSVASAGAPIDTLILDSGWWDASVITNRITDPELKRGAKVFFERGNCANCHANSFLTNFPSGNRFANIGLDSIDIDPAKQFKAPSLRNITLTAPYMHDGRFKTLREVIDHYSEGIKGNANLSWELGGPLQPAKFNFTEQEKQDLQRFLEVMLTDKEATSAVQFSDPFK